MFYVHIQVEVLVNISDHDFNRDYYFGLISKL